MINIGQPTMHRYVSGLHEMSVQVADDNSDGQEDNNHSRRYVNLMVNVWQNYNDYVLTIYNTVKILKRRHAAGQVCQ